jgi:hypothetical protein
MVAPSALKVCKKIQILRTRQKNAFHGLQFADLAKIRKVYRGAFSHKSFRNYSVALTIARDNCVESSRMFDKHLKKSKRQLRKNLD